MARSVLGLLILLAGLTAASAEAPPPTAPGVPVGSGAQPVVVYDADGKVVSFPDPNRTMVMPFVRTGDPFMLPAGPVPQQHQIAQPANTTTYRIVNPCSVDVRVKTVPTLSSTVTATTGTRILARTVETLASSPALTTPRIVSIMTMADPGAGGCMAEIGYGNGG